VVRNIGGEKYRWAELQVGKFTEERLFSKESNTAIKILCLILDVSLTVRTIASYFKVLSNEINHPIKVKH
jgi:hypothetical protein